MSFGEAITDLVNESLDPILQSAQTWQRVPLAEVVDILNGYPWPSSGFSGDRGHPVIRIRNVLDGETSTFYEGEIVDGYWVLPGELLVGMDGDFNRNFWSGPTALLNQRVCKLTTKPGFYDARFLYHVLPGYLGLINKHTSSVTVKHLSSKTLGEIPLPLPPLAEQKRIVVKLDALNAKSARARTELARIETLVSRYKQAVLRSAFLGAMTSAWRTKRADLQTASDLIDRTPTPPQPKGGREATDRVIQGKAALAINAPARGAPPKWQWVPLSRIARQETGHTPSRSHPEWWDGEIPWIGIKDAGANHGRIIEETIQTTNEEGLANSAARLLPAGTVCLSRTASVGYVTIMGKPMATSQDFVTWTCTEALVPKFLMYALMAEGDDIREFGKGTTHTTIYFPEVRAMQICLAPLEEQHEIVRRIESAFAKIDRLAKEAKRALELVGRLDEAILAKAFRGELVPQDENDEPAEHLLARIRAEREAAPKGKRGRKGAT
ncbi:putative Type-1 restriction enzyme EcoBI specificity protein [Pseudorhizobium banfieldiae]|uniref:Putative Type-1 restriction enzyme EcoBI specificity protein n=1 Tax=Pseudorhizobium banfieldiae TaxID=1125847 RepID=L0NM46_9HYPH|nr:restriction endonuclease subunit S [Pseudorhizobium banfieldiae]CAD6596337.1 restriction endonuclease subunit S [arsenite-oxidising bacterium NT-25]CCF21876.1 putative Type-1 restriction enzyme EcoBI specificity protein [Pseudorhizobium banfieldiae]